MVPLRLGAMPSTLQFLLINFQAEDEQIAENFVLGLSRLCHLDPIWPRPGACLQLECDLCICNYLVLVCRVFIFSPGHFRHFGVPSPKKNPQYQIPEQEFRVLVFCDLMCLRMDMVILLPWIRHDLTFATMLRALRSWDQNHFEKPLAGATCIRRGSWTWHPTQNLHKMRRFDTRSLW